MYLIILHNTLYFTENKIVIIRNPHNVFFEMYVSFSTFGIKQHRSIKNASFTYACENFV